MAGVPTPARATFVDRFGQTNLVPGRVFVGDNVVRGVLPLGEGVVLDPFAGSGTTLAVAAKLGRNAYGCELNPEYVKLAEARIREARDCVALFEQGGVV